MAHKFNKDEFESFPGYSDYRQLLERLTGEGKTTGEIQNEERVSLTKLNIVRMNRIDKTTVLTEELKNEIEHLAQEIKLVVITEGWCGDAANFVPLANLISASSEKIELRFVLRDDNPGIMNEYLTNGTKSIPLMIVLDGDFSELAVWGPRPQTLVNLIAEEKSKPGFTMPELKKNIQLWYASDKTIATQKEISGILKKINANEIHAT